MRTPIVALAPQQVSRRIALAFDGRWVRLQTPRPFTTVTLEGPRTEVQLQTDPSATTVVDLAHLPTPSFPLQANLGVLHCHGCDDTPLQLSSAALAAWAQARGRVADYDRWLVLCPDAPEQPMVRSWREAQMTVERAQQADLASDAELRLLAGDFPGAWSSVKACATLAAGPSAVCVRAEAHILTSFVARQDASVRAAVAVGQFEVASQAAWLCAIGVGEHPGCRALNEVIASGRLDWLARQAAAALERQDFGLARAQVEQCLALTSGEPRCVALQQSIATAQQTWRGREVERLLSTGRRALRRRRWLEVLAAAEACLLVAPDEARCAELQQRGTCRGRRCRAVPR